METPEDCLVHKHQIMEDENFSNDGEEQVEIDLQDAINDDQTLGNNARKSLRKYFTFASGNTFNSHESFKTRLQQEVPGLQEVFTEEECDFFVLFCPVVSRAGTDIEAALMKLNSFKTSGSKPTVIVVLHHTFDPQRIVPDSRRSLNRMDTITVDCLFFEDTGLLQCPKNYEAIEQIKKWIKSQVHEEQETGYLFYPTKILQYFWATFKNFFSFVPGSNTYSENPASESMKQMSEMVVGTKLRLVLLGRTGSGKSAAGNIILGREERNQAETSTETQQSESRQGEVAGCKVTLVDTPDWFCPGLSLEEVRQDVEFRTSLCASGPQAFLLVIPVKQSAGEEGRMLTKMEEMFGERCWRNAMILFTVTDEQQKENSEVFAQAGNQEVGELVKKCGNRFHFLNIKESGDGSQVSELLEKIEKMLAGNREIAEIYEMISDIEGEREERETTKRNIIYTIQKLLGMTYNIDVLKIKNDQRISSQAETKMRATQENINEMIKIRQQIETQYEKLFETEQDTKFFKFYLQESQPAIWLSIPNKQSDLGNRELKDIETELSKLNKLISSKMETLQSTRHSEDWTMV